jgi:hypothetical protein
MSAPDHPLSLAEYNILLISQELRQSLLQVGRSPERSELAKPAGFASGSLI